MVEFLKKATDWVLEKEEEAAKDCRIGIEDIEKQITMVQSKRDKLKKECEENQAELDHILKRLDAIKARELACKR